MMRASNQSSMSFSHITKAATQKLRTRVQSIWFDANGVVDVKSVLVVLDNMSFSLEDGSVTRVSPAFIALFNRCEAVCRGTLTAGAHGIPSTVLAKAIRKYPDMKTYPFPSTDKGPCKSPYHADAKQSKDDIDMRSNPHHRRCRTCYALEAKIRLASWCTVDSVEAQCGPLLGPALASFMKQPLTRHRLWVLLHVRRVSVLKYITEPFALDHPIVMCTKVDRTWRTNHLVKRVLGDGAKVLCQVLCNPKYEEYKRLIVQLYEDGWADCLTGTQHLVLPNATYMNIKNRPDGTSRRVVINKDLIALVRFLMTGRAELAASAIGRDYGTIRDTWFGPAHKKTLGEFVSRLESNPPEVIYGNCTIAATGYEKYPESIKTGKWFGIIWTLGHDGIKRRPFGPEHWANIDNKQACTVMKSELDSGLWKPVSCFDTEIIEHIKKEITEENERELRKKARLELVARRKAEKRLHPRRRDYDASARRKIRKTVVDDGDEQGGPDEERAEDTVESAVGSSECNPEERERSAAPTRSRSAE